MNAALTETSGRSRNRSVAATTQPWAGDHVLKVIMAVSGFLMFGFLAGHLSGNLLVFSGAAAMNQYAEFLHSKPVLLWTVRTGLLATVLVHVTSAVWLARSRKRARPVAYEVRRYGRSSYAARTMLLSGAWIAGFVVLHLLHFTTGTLHSGYRPGEPYQNLVYSFQSPLPVAAYVVTMSLIGLHLFHGLWSMFQTVGWSDARRMQPLRRLAVVLAGILAALFSSVPLAILAGIVKEGQ